MWEKLCEIADSFMPMLKCFAVFWLKPLPYLISSTQMLALWQRKESLEQVGYLEIITRILLWFSLSLWDDLLQQHCWCHSSKLWTIYYCLDKYSLHNIILKLDSKIILVMIKGNNSSSWKKLHDWIFRIQDKILKIKVGKGREIAVKTARLQAQ